VYRVFSKQKKSARHAKEITAREADKLGLHGAGHKRRATHQIKKNRVLNRTTGACFFAFQREKPKISKPTKKTSPDEVPFLPRQTWRGKIAGNSPKCPRVQKLWKILW